MSTSAAAQNIRTHTGMVHRARIVKGRPVPACLTWQQVARLHYAAPTDEPITCRYCAAIPAR